MTKRAAVDGGERGWKQDRTAAVDGGESERERERATERVAAGEESSEGETDERAERERATRGNHQYQFSQFLNKK